jgi:hypothetical protein
VCKFECIAEHFPIMIEITIKLGKSSPTHSNLHTEIGKIQEKIYA